ncbi:WD repeat-containing and planar cell polarity effector protein fritz homolog isoform X2 [Aplysia californica]|uniref:WD repeat-containing and planar cell polarity effector protein fritz homolog isoform X2 n=1 Tax=Aplysia californica TaxID=6500 RepID=A0ABM1VVQ8_APLCA|nr:WD repeat-containing and planar cell polarity effector protein fritz homolog isoform X2 [Aplysia californica]
MKCKQYGGQVWFLTLPQQIVIENSFYADFGCVESVSNRHLYDVIGCHSYHEKGEQVSYSEQPYYDEKQQFVEGRGGTWTPRNKRPERLRDSIKELEELLALNTCVHIRWRNRQVLQLVLSNGSITTFLLSGHSGDVERIFIDKSLVGKLSGEAICDACLTDQFFMASHSHSNRVDFAYFTKRPPLSEAAKRLEKLSAWEPKISQLDIPGPKGRRLDRKMSLNTSQDMLLIWWSVESGEAWPWSPISSDKDRANIVIISLNGPMAYVMTYLKTDCDPLHSQFSLLQPHRIFSVEQQTKGHGEVKARMCTYEIIRGKIQTASVVTVPLKNTIVCQGRNPQEDKLLIGLSDGSLVMYDDYRKMTLYTRAAVLPSCIAWHPHGNLVIVASARADIQIFDRALSPVKIQLVAEEPSPEKFLRISKFFRTSVTLNELDWCPFGSHSSELMTTNTDAVFLSFNKGPAALLQFHLGVRTKDRFSCLELVKEYIRHRQVDEAVGLLCSMKWDTEGPACYACLSTIVNHLLRMPLNAEREAQLEVALATFYAPKPAISEATILEYREPVGLLARRFFHLLLRYVRFDKAFLLAVDMGARDLFMDIHYMAAERGETALAEVAKRKAEQIETEGFDTLDDGDDDSNFMSAGTVVRNTYRERICEENLIDEVPMPGQMTWQQESYSVETEESRRLRELSEASIDAHFANGGLSTMSELNLQDELISDYTAALMEPSLPGAQGGAAAADRNGAKREDEDDGGGTGGGNVKVIHFGIV